MTTPAKPTPADLARMLDEAVAEFYDDPLGFVLFAWAWPVNGEPGPDKWQVHELEQVGAMVKARAFDGVAPVMPIRRCVSSGHGIGKSALSAWLVIWLMATRPDAHGTVTANTNEQLDKKTWAAVRAWLATSIVRDWFEINGDIMYRKGRRESWFCAPQSCAEENSEAFAGQHVKQSSSFYLFDEASAIPDKIFEVAEGGLTDGEPFIFLFGNATRNSGRFYRAAFGDLMHRWHPSVIDSRTCKLSNKALIAEWLEDVGGNEDDDFFKVRVRGLPPSADENQYIDAERIRGAMSRHVVNIGDEPVIYGVDVSGGGAAWTVAAKRVGLDARFPRTRISGEKSRDRSYIVSVLHELLESEHVDVMFIDSAFGAAVAERLRTLGHKNVVEVNFGGESVDQTCANWRALMWKRAKDWLVRGAITPKDVRLEMDLRKPGYHLNQKNKLVLESKESMQKRGEASPDDGDAFCLTFAQQVTVAKKPKSTGRHPSMPAGSNSWLA